MHDGRANRVVVSVDGRQISLSNLDKILYPETATTKGEVLAYYHAIAPIILPHLRERCITLRRYPSGVGGSSFFQKRCPSHRPEWVEVAPGPGDHKSPVGHCVIDDLPTLMWVANLAALELHAPMARRHQLQQPDMVVFDLDPGRPAAMAECAQVALAIRSVLENADLQAFPKTSGSKGLQVYLPVNQTVTYDEAALMERIMPGRTLTAMAKVRREGKVFIDWSQNAFHKTTIAAYSFRARPTPTVSTPVSWDEIRQAADGAELSFTFDAVLQRVEQNGDLFGATTTLRQNLPVARGAP